MFSSETWQGIVACPFLQSSLPEQKRVAESREGLYPQETRSASAAPELLLFVVSFQSRFAVMWLLGASRVPLGLGTKYPPCSSHSSDDFIISEIAYLLWMDEPQRRTDGRACYVPLTR